jgi:hypothetical protein
VVRDWEKISQKVLLEGEAVSAVFSKDLPIKGGKIIDTALSWIEEHPQGTAKTILGDVILNRRGIRNSLNHKPLNPEKLYTIPAIKTILEKSVFLGSLKDTEGKSIENYYFDAPIEIDVLEKYCL